MQRLVTLGSLAPAVTDNSHCTNTDTGTAPQQQPASSQPPAVRKNALFHWDHGIFAHDDNAENIFCPEEEYSLFESINESGE